MNGNLEPVSYPQWHRAHDNAFRHDVANRCMADSGSNAWADDLSF
ncbi:hypothetical protein [Leptolyngbya sp. FACHB-238]|nr:hypothetical protein [Leptolyngbya sp. FACHB-238]